ncbi:MAG: xanthine dehydrogenase family protein molybdopterin-binding subunit [Nitrospinota bacterium]
MKSAIGQPLPRNDGAAKASGKLRYVIDHLPSDALVGKILRSQVPHARIKRLDLDKARRAHGVHAVIGAGDIERHLYNPIYNQSNPHADLLVKDEVAFDSEIRHIGQPVAAVAAESLDRAEEALALIEVEYEERPGVFDMDRALKPDAPLVRPGGEGNVAFGWRDAHHPITLQRGSLDEGLQAADHVFEDEYATQRTNQTSLEPHVALCWPEEGGRLAVLATTQSIFGLRSCLAEALGMHPGQIRVIRPTLGGAFGKGLDLAEDEVICALLALRTEQAVRIEYTREEEFCATARHPSRIWLRTGVKADGTLTARHMKAWMECGSSANHGPSVVLVGGMIFMGAYNTPHYLYEGHAVYTNVFPSGAMRGYGGVQTNFAIECHMSRIAAELGVDEFEFRLKNAYRVGDVSPLSGFTVESCALPACSRRARELIGWDDPDARRSPAPEVKIGLGVAFSNMRNTGVHGAEDRPEKILEYSGAIVKLNEDGTVNLLTASIEQGAGQSMVLSQIVADALGIPVTDVSVAPSDTDSAPFDVATHASRITFVSGYAVHQAALQVRAQVIETAARMLGEPPENLEVEDGEVRTKAGNRRLGFQKVAEHSHYEEMRTIIGTASTTPPGNPPPFGVQCVKVAVDVETGVVEVLDMVNVHDIGRVVNPLGAEGQVTGAFVQGIGYALTEHLVVDPVSGVTVNGQMADYKLPTTLDVPRARVEFADSTDPCGLGVKSVAESAAMHPAPAIANAVADAIGVRVRELPLTPERVLEAIRGKSG